MRLVDPWPLYIAYLIGPQLTVNGPDLTVMGPDLTVNGPDLTLGSPDRPIKRYPTRGLHGQGVPRGAKRGCQGVALGAFFA